MLCSKDGCLGLRLLYWPKICPGPHTPSLVIWSAARGSSVGFTCPRTHYMAAHGRKGEPESKGTSTFRAWLKNTSRPQACAAPSSRTVGQGALPHRAVASTPFDSARKTTGAAPLGSSEQSSLPRHSSILSRGDGFAGELRRPLASADEPAGGADAGENRLSTLHGVRCALALQESTSAPCPACGSSQKRAGILTKQRSFPWQAITRSSRRGCEV